MKAINAHGREGSGNREYQLDGSGTKFFENGKRQPVNLALGSSSIRRRRISQADSKKHLNSLIREDMRDAGRSYNNKDVFATQRSNKKVFRATNGSVHQPLLDDQKGNAIMSSNHSLTQPGGGTFQMIDLK